MPWRMPASRCQLYVRALAEQGPAEPIGLVLLDSDPAPYMAETCVTAGDGLDVEAELNQAIAPFLTN